MNSLAILRRAPRRAVLSLIALALALALPACSAVFRSSIQGTVIDKETWERDRRSAGVVNASVYLYTDRAAWEEDLAAFVEGSEATLPDAKGKAAYRFFQSTKTDANGAYDFTGFIWESLFPKYGKTADRSEVFLLVYHPDYGLWPNPKPLYVVSEVTNQLGDLAIEDLWNEGRLAGTVVDWKDGSGLGGVTVNFYVATSWTYDSNGNFLNEVFPSSPTASTTTSTTPGSEGAWAATIRFPMKPNRSAHAAHNKAPVRVAFVREGYRANDPSDGTGLVNANVVDTEDIDKNGRSPKDGDYAEAFIRATLSYDTTKKEPVLVKIEDQVVMQRWRFETTASGRVFKMPESLPREYLNSVEVALSIPSSSPAIEAKDITRSRTIAEVTTEGHFNLGVIRWAIKDIVTQGGNQATMKAGTINITLTLDGAPPAAGDKTSMSPDVALTLELGQ